MKRYLLRFEPGGHTAFFEPGETVLEIARRMGYPLLASCAGRTNCGSCAVRVLGGELAPPGKNESKLLDTSKVRLGCRARTTESDVVLKAVVVPREEAFLLDTRKVERVGVAVDLGTSNISIALVNLDELKVFAEGRQSNVQASWGADVLSRLSYSLESEENKTQLKISIQNQVLKLIHDLIGDDLSALEALVVAGNSVMAGLFCGSDLSSLASSPFDAPKSYVLDSGPLFEAIPKGAKLQVLSPLAAFVGGDTRALIQTFDTNTETLLIDIGTNIECAYIRGEELIVGSAPAGSAFAALGRQGSELLKFIEKLLRIGALNREGLLDEEHYRVSRNEEGILQASIEKMQLSQLEIREIQLGKAALAVLVDALLKEAKSDGSSIERLVITGAFGAALPLELLFETAILPSSLESIPQKELLLEGVQNAAVKLLVNDYPELDQSKIKLVNVAHEAQFQDNYFKALLF